MKPSKSVGPGGIARFRGAAARLPAFRAVRPEPTTLYMVVAFESRNARLPTDSQKTKRRLVPFRYAVVLGRCRRN